MRAITNRNRTSATRGQRRSFASRVFGYDIFISFALGPPPRGTHSYASDLARRLRELDFAVFFSEDEASPGEQLDATLRTALHRSKTLVVIANRGTLENPRWVRTEVEEFRRRHPDRAVIPINVGGALQDPEIARRIQEWLDASGKIWLDEADDAVETGIASAPLVERLSMAPRQVKANVRWRWVTRATGAILVGLTILAASMAWIANERDMRARAELRRAVSLKLISEAQGMLAGQQAGGDERALLQLLAAHRIEPGIDSEAALASALVQRSDMLKLLPVDAPVSVVATSPDDSRIVTSSGRRMGPGMWETNFLRLWDAGTGEPIGAPWYAGGPVNSIAFDPEGRRIVSGGSDRTVRVWDGATGKALHAPFEGHQTAVATVAFSADGARVISGDDRGLVFVWDATSGEVISGPLGEDRDAANVVFGRNGEQAVSANPGGTARAWEAVTGGPTGPPFEIGIVRSLAYSAETHRIVVGGDSSLGVWNALTGEPEVARVEGQTGSVWSVAFNRDGSRIAFGAADHSIRLWDGKSGTASELPLQGHRDTIWSVVFTADGKRVISGSGDTTVRLWRTHARRSIGLPIAQHGSDVSSVAYNPEGSLVASGSVDGVVRVWDARTGAPRGEPLERHSNMVSALAFDRRGGRFASGSTDGTALIWDSASGQRVAGPLKAYQGPVSSIAWSPDGARIATGGHSWKQRRSTDHVLRLWDARTGEPAGAPLEGHESPVTSVVFAPDGSRIVSVSGSNVHLWDGTTGQHIAQWSTGSDAGTVRLSFGCGGACIITLSGDELRSWDTKTGSPLRSSVALDRSVASGVFAFSSDGSRGVTGSTNGTLRVWDVVTGRAIGPDLSGHERAVKTVSYRDDGGQIVSGGDDRSVRLWPGPKAWPDEVCAKLTRNMSRAQWAAWVSPEIDYVCQCPGLPIAPDPASAVTNERCPGKPAAAMFP